MAQIQLIHDDAVNVKMTADLIVTDPPYEMSGAELAKILGGIECEHLVLITTMSQLIELVNSSDWKVNFDFVLDAVVPKKSKSIRQPNYTHQTGVYLTRNNAKSIFNRKLYQRSDAFDNKGFWSTVIRAPRNRSREHGHAKNEQALIDIIGAFEADTVIDCFAGSGTTGMACFELDKKCVLVEKDRDTYTTLQQQFRFLNAL